MMNMVIKHNYKYMKISKKVIDEILKNNQFSLKIAMILDIQQTSVKALARSNSDKLGHARLVEFYKEQGFTDEEIWE
ncbi:hypothetical protein [Bergeyella zoohelcum]|uniref:Uncharacterized protein n=1 Tax=Bergeyella zoohelcum TaxID=1015 RepID=A0A376C0B4_9FLAO|nr:hypothetical protein [Bergeyella zoohelcum]EKB60741.1 hypothetical protein HMPREF9700_00236 [Bergeyella zoohelcum CCUG 30536]SSZ47169.1 Uncharacterised protein [Bergeyella zoohelcum]